MLGCATHSFDELFEFVRGKRHPLDTRTKKARGARLMPPKGRRGWTLDEIEWDEETLRILMQQMLERANIGPFDLLTMWVPDEMTPQLTRREFAAHMHELFRGHQHLWETEVSAVVEATFHSIVALWKGASGTHLTAHVDTVRFERWLNPPTERPAHRQVVRKSREQLQRLQRAQQHQHTVSSPQPAIKVAPKRAAPQKASPEQYRVPSTAKLGALRHVRLHMRRKDATRRARLQLASTALSPLSILEPLRAGHGAGEPPALHSPWSHTSHSARADMAHPRYTHEMLPRVASPTASPRCSPRLASSASARWPVVQPQSTPTKAEAAMRYHHQKIATAWQLSPRRAAIRPSQPPSPRQPHSNGAGRAPSTPPLQLDLMSPRRMRQTAVVLLERF